VGRNGNGHYQVRYGRRSAWGKECWFNRDIFVGSDLGQMRAGNVPCTDREFCRPDSGQNTCWVKYMGAIGETPAIPMEPNQPIANPVTEPFTVSLGAEDLILIALVVVFLANLVFLVYRCCRTRAAKVVQVFHGVERPIKGVDTDQEEANLMN